MIKMTSLMRWSLAFGLFGLVCAVNGRIVVAYIYALVSQIAFVLDIAMRQYLESTKPSTSINQVVVLNDSGPPVPPSNIEMTFVDLVAAEIAKARSKHEPIHSLHEGYAVLLEEVDELWDEVKKRTAFRDQRNVLLELVQIGAMAQRVAEDTVMAVAIREVLDHHGCTAP